MTPLSSAVCGCVGRWICMYLRFQQHCSTQRFHILTYYSSCIYLNTAFKFLKIIFFSQLLLFFYIRKRGGAVVRPLACHAKVPRFKSSQNFSCPPCSKRVPDIRQCTIMSNASLWVPKRQPGCILPVKLRWFQIDIWSIGVIMSVKAL